MNCSSFPDAPAGRVVADASVLINLNASGHAKTIIAASCGVLYATTNAYAEVLDGERLGYADARPMRELEGAGILRLVALNEADEPVYRSLIEGFAAQTLDDGEAATVAHAVANGAIALIDEKKAQRICGQRFPGTTVVTTADLLLHHRVANTLGDHHVGAIHAALVAARMHVPRHLLGDVVALLGDDRALECPSLPRRSVAGATR